MAMDPKAAAAAAQAAAEAARVAAAEAAREAAIAAAKAAATESSTDDTAAAIGAPERSELAGSDVAAATEVQVETAVIQDMTAATSALSGSTRPDVLGLPSLGSAAMATPGSQLGDPPLGSAAPSGGGTIGKSAVADYGPVDLFVDVITDTTSWVAGEVKDAVVDWAEEAFDGPPPGPSKTGEVDGGTPDPDEVSGGSEGRSDPDLDAGTPDEGDGDDDDPESAGTSGADAGGGGDVPAEDGQVVLPPGWVNVEDLDFIPGERQTGGIVAGATGQDPSGGESSGGTVGPQGGDWAINPGSEGTMYEVGRYTNLRDADAWYGGVAQPVPDPDPTIAPDPTLIEQPAMGPDPGTVNPSRGDSGETASARVQASTAYAAAAAPAGGGSTVEAEASAGAEGGAEGAEAQPIDADPLGGIEASDPGSDLEVRELDDDGDARGSQGRGREWGHSQGRGGGRDDARDSDELGE